MGDEAGSGAERFRTKLASDEIRGIAGSHFLAISPVDDVGRLGREVRLAPAASDPVLFRKQLRVSLVHVLVVELDRGVRRLTEGTLSGDVPVRQLIGTAAVSTLEVISKPVSAAEDSVAEVANALPGLLQLRRVHRLLYLLVVLRVEVEDVTGEGHGRWEEVAADLAVDPALASAILMWK